MRFICFILLFLVVASCKPSITTVLCEQEWKFDGFDISSELESELAGNVSSSTRKKIREMLRTNASKTKVNWRFYPDNQCAMLSDGQYSTGHWELNEKTGLLNIVTGNNREAYRLESKDKELILWELGGKNDSKEQFAATLQPSAEYENKDMDLLAPARNTWRIKPTHPEMFQDIKKRLTEQITYMIDYFELVEKSEQGYFRTDHLNAPFRFYSGGIGLFNNTELPDAWVGQFYNQGDALMANVLLTTAFRSDLTFPSGSKSHTASYARFLKQLKVVIQAQEEPERLPVQ